MALPSMATLLSGESARVEWKESDADGKKLLRAVCALANDLENSGEPGFLVIGVKDETGEAIGLPYGDHKARDDAQQRLENRIASSLLVPQPSVSIHGVEVSTRWLIVVEVAPYPAPPVVRCEGEAWIRRGTTTRRASEADLARLTERRPENQGPFDQRTVLDATLADLDTRTLKLEHDAAKEGDESRDEDTFPGFEAWLGQKGLARRARGAFVPTVAGILLHGVDSMAHFRGAAIDVVKYEGVDEESRLIARKTLTGPLPDQLDAAWALIDEWNLERMGPSDGIRQGFVRDYPPEALKELARNLVQHRSYERTNAPSRITWFADRVELSNPGGPFGAASEGEFGAHSDYRNPTITARLAELGYVQRLGRGVRLARKQLEKAGHPPLEVETDGFTTITVRAAARGGA